MLYLEFVKNLANEVYYWEQYLSKQKITARHQFIWKQSSFEKDFVWLSIENVVF